MCRVSSDNTDFPIHEYWRDLFLGSSALGCAVFEPAYASVLVTAIVRDGIAPRARIPDEAIERAAITASGIETCSTDNRATR